LILQAEKNNTRSFTGQSLYIFAAKFFPALAFTIVGIFASKTLSTGAYGQFQNFWIQLFTLSAIATIGFPIFILTYSASKALAILRQINRRGKWIYSVFSLSLLLVFYGLQSTNLDQSVWIAPLVLGSFIVLVFCDALLLVFKSYKGLISSNALFAVMFCGIHISQLQHNYSLVLQYVLLLCLARITFSLWLIRRCIQALSTNHPEELAHEEWQQTKKLWWHLGINDTINVLFRWIDKFLLSFLLLKEVFAIYSNATNEIAFLPIIFSAVSSAAIQHWAVHHQQQANAQHKIPLLHYSAQILASIIFPLFFFLMLFRVSFLSTVFGPTYVSGISIFVCAQLVLPLRAYPFSALLQSMHRGDIINKGALIDFMIACVLMYPMYLLLGLPGIALSFVISTYWQAIYYLRHTARLLGLSIASLIPMQSLLQKWIIYGCIFTLAYTISHYFIKSVSMQFIFGISCFVVVSVGSLWIEWKKGQQTGLKA
jgi:O-antigen/teichoic acid export membrane protein